MEKVIYFAGGCFWGVEHFFQGVDGVLEATPGYANGHLDRQPSYQEVYTDTTGFAETVSLWRSWSTCISPSSTRWQ